MNMMIKKLIPEKIRNYFVNKAIQTKYDVIFASGATAGRNTVFEGKNFINMNASVYSSFVGLGTYISGDSKINKAHIGRFCSIGQNVKNYFGQHPASGFVSTHPCFFSMAKQAGFTFVTENIFEEHKYIDDKKKYVTMIGNDVWIGNNVSLMEGISIGNGAIIATGAVVTKDVAPYSIVGGVPAKLIKMRFDKSEVEFLEKYQWWNRDLEWIRENSKYFSSIEKLKGLQ